MKTRSSLLAVVLAFLLPSLPIAAQLQVGQTYRIVPVSATGKSLFVKNSTKTANTEVQIWTETDVPAQQWTLGTVGSQFTFRNVYTGQYLALTSSTRGATTRQVISMSGGRWRIEAVNEAEGIYLMKPSSGSYLLTAETTADGDLPKLATATKDETQQWLFIPI